jgi:hypothetical protein
METRKVGEGLEFGHRSPAQEKCLDQFERVLQRAIELGMTHGEVFDIYQEVLRRVDMATLRYLAGQEKRQSIQLK